MDKNRVKVIRDGELSLLVSCSGGMKYSGSKLVSVETYVAHFAGVLVGRRNPPTANIDEAARQRQKVVRGNIVAFGM